MLDYNKQVKVIYPKAEEELRDFLNRCKLKYYRVMLYPRCSSVFDKQTSKEVENSKPRQPRKSDKLDKQGRFIFEKRGFPHILQKSRNYIPPTNAPVREW